MDETLRNKAIDITRRHLVRQGSRRVSMDMIAREMHISKKTLYILFSDKRNLVGTCIAEMRKEYEDKVGEYLSHSSGSAWDNFNWLLREYLRSLYEVDYSFLLDMQNGRDCDGLNGEFHLFWQKVFEEIIYECRENGFVTTGFSITSFVENLLVWTNKSRIEGISLDEQESFCKILIRGIAALTSI